MSEKIAVVLFNLGGPDGPDAVRPFLQNLFSDPAILRVPGLVRGLLARLIARRRAPVAREIYKQLGGRSPILENTEAQARALAERLAERWRNGDTPRVFVAMRYWRPFAREAAAEVAKWSPDKIVLLPLYPQYSTTTTRSSLRDWRTAARRAALDAPTTGVCCYPDQRGFVAAAAATIRDTLKDRAGPPPRLLFSAHGLPERIVAAGDPYQWQVEATAAALAAALGPLAADWRVCYQSRVGPLAWIGPSTEDEIARAAADGVAVLVAPIAFVSEHSETLVELDIEYRNAAQALGINDYMRAPTVSVQADFIAGLADLVDAALARNAVTSASGGRVCPAGLGGCWMEGAA